MGTPYRYGGTGPGGFDCSGFVRYIFAQFDINLPHNAAAQYGNGTEVGKADLAPGDLVFFACGRGGIDHVGIYSGGDQFIHSSSPRSGGVIFSSLSSGYYGQTYVGGRRILR
ncbi:MAG: C40 family peptidase [Acetobacterium sp.]|nr:C40 family peptidase [Acetobacterium sp.]